MSKSAAQHLGSIRDTGPVAYYAKEAGVGKAMKRALKRKDRRRERRFEAKAANGWLSAVEQEQQREQLDFELEVLKDFYDPTDYGFDELDDPYYYDDDYYDDNVTSSTRCMLENDLREQRVECPHCMTSNEGDASYCKHCGASMHAHDRSGDLPSWGGVRAQCG